MTEETAKEGKYLVSATHLHVKSLFKLPYFVYLAFLNFFLAGTSKGFVCGKALRFGNTWCTVSVWTSFEEMMAFNHAGVHKKALRAMASLCDEGVHGHYYSDSPEFPGWQVPHDFLLKEGKTVKLPDESERQKQKKWPRPPKNISKSLLVNMLLIHELPIIKLSK